MKLFKTVHFVCSVGRGLVIYFHDLFQLYLGCLSAKIEYLHRP